MRRARRVLLFGRFQPFHLGHVALTRWALFELGFDEIVFLVGMASENYTPRNPFTAGERIEMIRLSLSDERLPLERVVTATIRTMEINIGNMFYVLSYVPRVEAIMTRNPVLAKMASDAGLRVVVPPSFNRDEWRGETIRLKIARGDETWRRALTPSTASFIEEIGGVERIRAILSQD
ncbi:MAG: nicotinamide-nucleotide adenylyltransferase [Acidilobaceae archaeon]